MILIIDDDLAVRTSLSLLFSCNGFEPQSVATPDEALAIVRRSKPQLILLDLNFSLNISGEEGLELLSKIRIFQPQVPVVLITAWGSIQLAVEGMKRGAVNFITKPWNNFQLLDVVRTSIELAASEPSMTDNHREAIEKIKAFDSIVGRSPKLIAILNSILRVAPTNASVLITGESGTGKEMIAQAIHELSKRKGHPFVKVNLGGLTQSLFESEMFGHRKGAFTDAYADRKGRFELADKGTIFLDEIGDLDPLSQVKLLRVLQDQTFEPLGDSRPKTVDVRVVCATNRDLPQLIKAGSFREDLYYRINLITLHLPSLRERIEDIPLLAESFLANIAERENRAGLMISPDGKEWLMQHIRTERAHIRSQHHFLDLLIDASPLGMLILGFDEEITRVNPAASRIIGIETHQLVGSHLKDFESELCQAISSIDEERDVIVRLNGYQKYHIRRAGFYDRGFNHPFIIIEELTQEMVKTERESYTRVIRMMSHEVNNTVGAINSILQSMVQFIETSNYKSESEPYLVALQVAIKRNEGLDLFMRNFANVVKLPQPSIVEFDLIRLLDSVVLLNRALAIERNVSLVFDLHQKVLLVKGDYSMLEQAFINMVKNAIEASMQNGEVTFHWLKEERCLVVSNEGVEITEEVKERLFSPFFSTKPNGQGIGLIMIREIFNKHHIRFSFTSTKGKSEFRVWF